VKSFLPFIAQQPLCRAYMSNFVQKKPKMVAPGWAFDPKRDRAIPDGVARSG
jgi:hypothetical protein